MFSRICFLQVVEYLGKMEVNSQKKKAISRKMMRIMLNSQKIPIYSLVGSKPSENRPAVGTEKVVNVKKQRISHVRSLCIHKRLPFGMWLT